MIHRTTLTPTKPEPLTGWLPKQSRYAGGTGTPDLVMAGGFRLDDPGGAVGIEFLIVADAAAREPVVRLVPMGCRGAPLEGASGGADRHRRARGARHPMDLRRRPRPGGDGAAARPSAR
ncbi:hypothetical protein GCM10009564_17640 [Streptomyces thermogriseus]|uniref:Maltokinase N-terminal cap domain-containing protein n=1 Tax=Streptomyces thermogriseus TaxID=75292 RepID=A0ABN1SX91_9ACTN